ncbi:MAG: discoidin domain-containing protein [Gammaproteobacteria bacterium]
MQTEVLDDFEDLSGWSAVASGQAQLVISSDAGLKGKAMRLDFDFKGGHGFVVARKHFSLLLPECYAFRFNMRGFTPANKFELKLIDPPGNGVWWYRQEAFGVSEAWRYLEIKNSEIEFAWGPAGGGAMTHVGAIELVIVADSGGKGTVWIEDLRFEDRSFLSDPVARASSALLGYEPRCAVDHSPQTSWRSEISGERQWLLLDFEQERELGGVIVHWVPALAARDFDVQIANDAAAWRTVYTAREVRGERSYIYLPNTVSRYLRVNLHQQGIQKQGFGIVELEIKSYEFSRSINAFFQNLAKLEPKGLYPKYLYGAQTYWSPVATPEGSAQGLLNEEGMVEIDQGSVSIEPFLYIDNKLLTWADVALAQELEQGSLPIPSSLWRKDGILLKITAFAAGDPGQAVLCIRYRVENEQDKSRHVRLFVAVRPFQVTPPWQAFKSLGGVSPIRELAFRQDGVWVNRNKIIVPLHAPDRFGAATFDQGGLGEYLKTGELPPHPEVSDGFGYAAGALCYMLDLNPSGAQEIFVAAPFGAKGSERSCPLETKGAWQFAQAVRAWKTKLRAVEIHLPAAARGLTDIFRTAAAHILVNRDGPALQPGPRRYTRCWIRDGATMAAPQNNLYD